MTRLGSIVFDEVTGQVQPGSSAQVDVIDNPALAPAVLVLPTSPAPGRLAFKGWFAASQAAALAAYQGTSQTATDERGVEQTVLVMSVSVREIPAAYGAVIGVWCEADAEVLAWA